MKKLFFCLISLIFVINTYANTITIDNKTIFTISSLLTNEYINLLAVKIKTDTYKKYYFFNILICISQEIDIIHELSDYNPKIKELFKPQLLRLTKLFNDERLQEWLEKKDFIRKIAIQLKDLLPDEWSLIEVQQDLTYPCLWQTRTDEGKEFWNNYICTIGRINLDRKIEVLENYLNGDETRPQEAMIEMIITSWNAAATLQFMLDPTLASFANAKEFEYFIDFLKNEWPTLPEELKSRFYEEPLINAWLDAWQTRINALKE